MSFTYVVRSLAEGHQDYNVDSVPTSFTVTMPGTVEDGDFLYLALASIAGTSNFADLASAGWTQLGASSTNCIEAVYYKLAASEPAAYVVGGTAGGNVAVAWVVIALRPDALVVGVEGPSAFVKSGVNSTQGGATHALTEASLAHYGSWADLHQMRLALSTFRTDGYGSSVDNSLVLVTMDSADPNTITSERYLVGAPRARMYSLSTPADGDSYQYLYVFIDAMDTASAFSAHAWEVDQTAGGINFAYAIESYQLAMDVGPDPSGPPDSGGEGDPGGGGGTTSGGGGGTRQGSYEVKTAVAHGKRRRIQIAVLPHMLNDQMLRE